MKNKKTKILKLKIDEETKRTNSTEKNVRRSISEVYLNTLKEIDELLEKSKRPNNPGA